MENGKLFRTTLSLLFLAPTNVSSDFSNFEKIANIKY